MTVSLSRLAFRQLRNAQRAILQAVEDLDEAQFAWRPDRGPQSIAWHVWHTARWDDHMCRRLGELEELWAAQALRERWGWPAELELGEESAGTGLAEEAAEGLEFPPKADVVAYAGAVFERSQKLVSGLSDELLAEPWEEGGRATKADAVLGFAGHDFEHSGMIAALKGLQGLRGTPD